MGNQKYLEIIEKDIKSSATSDYSAIKRLDNLNKKYNVYMIYYPKYEDEEIETLHSKIKELTKANEEF